MVGFSMQAGDTSETTLAAEGKGELRHAVRVVLNTIGMLPMCILDVDQAFSQ